VEARSHSHRKTRKEQKHVKQLELIIEVLFTKARVRVPVALVQRSDCVEASTVVWVLTAPLLRLNVVPLVQLTTVARMIW